MTRSSQGLCFNQIIQRTHPTSYGPCILVVCFLANYYIPTVNRFSFCTRMPKMYSSYFIIPIHVYFLHFGSTLWRLDLVSVASHFKWWEGVLCLLCRSQHSPQLHTRVVRSSRLAPCRVRSVSVSHNVKYSAVLHTCKHKLVPDMSIILKTKLFKSRYFERFSLYYSR